MAFFSNEKVSFPRFARPPITPIRKETKFLTASGFLSSFSPTQKQHQRPVPELELKSRAFSSLSKCL